MKLVTGAGVGFVSTSIVNTGRFKVLLKKKKKEKLKKNLEGRTNDDKILFQVM